jgi:hypothetical protein
LWKGGNRSDRFTRRDGLLPLQLPPFLFRGPVNAFTLWKADDVKVTRGSELLGQYNKTDFSVRRFCTNCGGHVLVDHPTLGLVDVHASTIPSLAFKPAVHLNYVESVLPMRDGLPKLKDFPVPAGGSGELVPE